MYLKLVLFCCFVALSTGNSLPRPTGASDAKLGEFPYLVNLYKKTTINSDSPIAYGGGAILNERWILADAQNVLNSVRESTGLDDIAVIAANIHLRERSEFEQIVNISNIVVHPSRYDAYADHLIDFTLIKLKTPLKFNEYVQPIDLPQPNNHPRGFGVIAGFATSIIQPNAIRPETLQTQTLPIITNDECFKLFEAAYENLGGFTSGGDDVGFCTGSLESNSGHCLNLTGNPFVTEENGKKVLTGMATAAVTPECPTYATTSLPSIYTYIFPANDWIRETMSKK